MTSQRQVPSAPARNVVFVVLYVPLPLTLTCWLKAGVAEQVASLGLKSLKVIVPPALLVAPLMVAASLGSRFCAVLMPGVLGLTTRCSLVQALVAPLLLASPE